MTDLFIGGEIDGLMPSSGDVYESTQSGRFDPDAARGVTFINTSASYAQSPTFSGQSDFWAHWRGYLYQPFGPVSAIWTAFAGATPVARLAVDNAGALMTMTAEVYSGGAWVQVGDSWGMSAALHTFDVRVNVAGGSLEVYSSGTQLVNVSGLSLSGNVTFCRWYGNISSIQGVSEIMLATTSTIGVRIVTRHVSADGAVANWTGSFTDVNELVYTDATALSSASNGDISTFVHDGPDIDAYVIRSVGVNTRAKKGSSGPANAASVVRVGSTNYAATTRSLGSGYGAVWGVWETNPATAAAWDSTALEAAEIGVKSIT